MRKYRFGLVLALLALTTTGCGTDKRVPEAQLYRVRHINAGTVVGEWTASELPIYSSTNGRWIVKEASSNESIWVVVHGGDLQAVPMKLVQPQGEASVSTK